MHVGLKVAQMLIHLGQPLSLHLLLIIIAPFRGFHCGPGAALSSLPLVSDSGLTASPQDRHHCLHFIDNKAGSRKDSDLPQSPQPIRAEIQRQTCLTPKSKCLTTKISSLLLWVSMPGLRLGARINV